MSFKRNLHPLVSKAEIEVFKALSREGLTTGMVTQKVIILKVTIPDFTWESKRKVLFLDGVQVHRKDKVQQRDEEIDNLLALQGWDVLRIPYEPPLSEKNLMEIMVTVKKFLGADET